MTSFDKNAFKNAFRSWVQANPRAADEDALAFCHTHIPASQIMSHFWLVEQSLQWFGWLKSRKAFDHQDFHEEGHDDGLVEAHAAGSRTVH